MHDRQHRADRDRLAGEPESQGIARTQHPLPKDLARSCRCRACQEHPPERGPVRLPFPLCSPLSPTNRPRLAPAEPLSWREVTRVSRRAVGIEDWSSNRIARTEERATARWGRDFTATLDSSSCWKRYFARYRSISAMICKARFREVEPRSSHPKPSRSWTCPWAGFIGLSPVEPSNPMATKSCSPL